MKDIYNLLIKKVNKAQVLVQEPMSRHTSFKIGGPADFYVRVEKEEELKHLLEISKEHDIPLTIVGNGTNLLVRDRRNKRHCGKTAFYGNRNRK